MRDRNVPAAEGIPFSQKNLTRRFFQNTAVLLVGWNLNALGRLLAARLVVGELGVTVFGEYALLVVWMTIAEWILDFGTTEVFVREVNQALGQRDRLVRIFLVLKVIQAPLAVLVLLTGLLAMQYSQRLVAAGMVAGFSLLFFAVVSLYRAVFKAALTMEREVAAEFMSVLVMVASIPLVAHFGWGLIGVMGAYGLSRVVFLAGCVAMAPAGMKLSIRGVESQDIRWGIQSSFAIGVIGFVVVVYNATDLLVLSRTVALTDVAIYSAAQRFTLPLLMALNAIAVSAYPVLALVKSPEQFRQTCQRAVDATVLMGGFALVFLWCGAEFIMRLLGSELVGGAQALRVLAVMCVIKAVSMVIGPVLFLVHAQRYALAYMVLALILKMVVVGVAALKFGYMGAAAGALGVELFFLAPVTMYFVRRFTGFSLQYSGIWRIAVVTGGVIAATRSFLPNGTLAAAALAASLYALLIVTLGMIRPSEIQALLRRESV